MVISEICKKLDFVTLVVGILLNFPDINLAQVLFFIVFEKD